MTGEVYPTGPICGDRWLGFTLIEPGFLRKDFLDTSSVTSGAYDIGDYAEPVARFKAWHDDMNHQQIRDPAKFGRHDQAGRDGRAAGAFRGRQ